MKKSLIFASIAIVAFGSLFANGEKENGTSGSSVPFNKTGLPIVNEKVALKVAGFAIPTIKKPFEELEVYKMINEATNVDIIWDITPKASWNEKKSLILASGDWPDVFYGNYIMGNGEIVKNAADGVFIPLNDLIDEYAPNVQAVYNEYPEFVDFLTAPDGNMYSLPTIDHNFPNASSAQFINKKWLDELGMDIPGTTDEFYRVLKAFKAAGKEIPFTFRYENNIQGINGMFGSFGLVDNSDKLTVVDGEVLYTPIQPEYVEAIKYFHKLFDEGLIDPESFNQTVPVFKSKIKEGVGVANMWSLSWLFGGNYQNSDYVFMPPLTGPEGDSGYMWKQAADLSGKGSFLITSTCEIPEIAMRLADYMVTPEVSFQVCLGLLGVTYNKLADGRYEAIADPEGMGHGDFRHMTTAGACSFNMVPASFGKKVITSPGIAEKNSYDEVYKNHVSNMLMPPLFISPEAALRASELSTDIGGYVQETTASWLLNGGIEEEFDGFVKQLKNMGLDEMVAIYQDRYDEVYK